MKEITNIEQLNINSVSVLTQKEIEIDGVLEKIGQPHVKTYMNDEHGRGELKREIGEPYLSSILAMWGTEPKFYPVAEETNKDK